MHAKFLFRLLLVALLVNSAIASSAFASSDAGGSLIFTYEPGSTHAEGIATLDKSGTTASIVVQVNSIPLPANEHSPACTPGRLRVGTIPVHGNRLSECMRICILAPANMEIDAARGVVGTTSHAWSQIFSTEWYRDKQQMCAHVKNWSADTPAVATLTIGVCPVGIGCVNFAPTIVAPTRLQTPRETTNSFRERNAIKYQ